MRTALDTNILSSVLTGAAEAATITAQLLRLHAQEALVVCGPVFIELSAIPGFDLECAEKSLKESSITIDFDLVTLRVIRCE